MARLKFAIIFLLCLSITDSYGGEKLIPPTGDELKDATESIDQIYGSQIKRARKVLEIIELAEKLRQEADEQNDSARQYALMISSRDLHMKAGNHPAALDVVDELESVFELKTTPIRFEVLADAATSRSIDPISRWLLAFAFHNATRESLIKGDPDQSVNLAELAEKSAEMSGNQKLEEFAKADMLTVESLIGASAERSKIDQAFPELKPQLELKGKEGFPEKRRTIKLGQDKHKGFSGADDILNVYYLKLKPPVNVNDLFLIINGQKTHLGRGTSLGKISASFDGEQWFPIGEWDTEACLLAAKRQNLFGIKLSGPEMLEIDKLAVKFDYTKGSDGFEVFQVTAVR